MIDYPLNSSELERWRLSTQSQSIEPLSIKLLEGVGVEAGKHVLDLGCGPGGLSILAAQRVGPHGSVTGVDRDPEQLSAARKNAENAGVTNIEFVCSELNDYAPPRLYDVIIGRYVLIYVQDPDVLIEKVSKWLAANGRFGFLEMDLFKDVRSHVWPPVSNETADAIKYIGKIMIDAGIHTYMGTRLPSILMKYGAIGIASDAPPQIGPRSLALPLAALKSVLPLAKKLGDPDADKYDPDVLYERETEERDETTVTTPPLSVAAWTTPPN